MELLTVITLSNHNWRSCDSCYKFPVSYYLRKIKNMTSWESLI